MLRIISISFKSTCVQLCSVMIYLAFCKTLPLPRAGAILALRIPRTSTYSPNICTLCWFVLSVESITPIHQISWVPSIFRALRCLSEWDPLSYGFPSAVTNLVEGPAFRRRLCVYRSNAMNLYRWLHMQSIFNTNCVATILSRDQRTFVLVWRCHQLLSGSLLNSCCNCEFALVSITCYLDVDTGLLLLLLLLSMQLISRCMDLWKIICIFSLCLINKLSFSSFSILSFLLWLPIFSSFSQIIKELFSFFSSSYSLHFRYLSFNGITKKTISS